jgi:hypothetical protein
MHTATTQIGAKLVTFPTADLGFFMYLPSHAVLKPPQRNLFAQFVRQNNKQHLVGATRGYEKIK